MRSDFVITFILLVASSLILTACGSEVETPTYPDVDEQISSPEDAEAYPYPDNELYLPVTGSNPAYPGLESDERTEPNPGVIDPYPSVDDSGNSKYVLDFKDLSPVASDKNLETGSVFIEESDLIVKKEDSEKVEVIIIGNLPTPCHQLRIKVAEPTADGRIDIDAYSVTDPKMICIQMVTPFETSVELKDLEDGAYTVIINGKQTASFELP